MRQMLRLGAAAKYLGTSPTSLKRWANLGLCPCLKSPLGQRYWTKELLDKIYQDMIDSGGVDVEHDKATASGVA